jgi:hypothetical protein
MAEVAREILDALESAHEDQCGSKHNAATCSVCNLVEEFKEAIANA